MNEEQPPSTRYKDAPDNADRPPPAGRKSVQWDFIRFGLRQRVVESNLLAVVYDKHYQ